MPYKKGIGKLPAIEFLQAVTKINIMIYRTVVTSWYRLDFAQLWICWYAFVLSLETIVNTL